jgi:hypothetical protein
MDDLARAIELEHARTQAAYLSCVNTYRTENDLERLAADRSEYGKGTNREIEELKPIELTDVAPPPDKTDIKSLQDKFMDAQTARIKNP